MIAVPDGLRALLLDVDGNLRPPEERAFAASAGVVNRFLAALGLQARVRPDDLLAARCTRLNAQEILRVAA